MSAPVLHVAARAKFLASQEFVMLDAADSIGTVEGTSEPTVFVGVDPRNGLPWSYEPDKAAVTIYQRAASWLRGESSARFPLLGVTVWVAGSDGSTPDADWLARNVAEQVIECFDDPANANDPQWSDTVRVLHCRWTGELAVSEVENMPGMYRADCAFEAVTA